MTRPAVQHFERAVDDLVAQARAGGNGGQAPQPQAPAPVDFGAGARPAFPQAGDANAAMSNLPREAAGRAPF